MLSFSPFPQICGGCVIFLGIIVLIAGIVVGGMLTTVLDEGLKKVIEDEVYVSGLAGSGSGRFAGFELSRICPAVHFLRTATIVSIGVLPPLPPAPFSATLLSDLSW